MDCPVRVRCRNALSVLLASCVLLGVPGRGHAQDKPRDLQEAALQQVLRLIREFYVREVDLPALEADARARGVDSMVGSLDSESRVLFPADLQALRHNTVVSRPLAGMLPDHIGYVAIFELRENVAAELTDALAGLRRRGMKALVLDVRGSSGGLLSEAVPVCQLFLGGGRVVFRSKGRSTQVQRTWTAEGKPPYADLPLAVVVDQYTAAGSEIIVGALQDHRRAIVVGSRTFGKGTIQSLWLLPGGSALTLTTATWMTPAGREVTRPPGSADGGGIVPDVEVLLPPDLEVQARGLRMNPEVDLADLVARDSLLSTAARLLVAGRSREPRRPP